ncbi:unnamed protein product [Citrullus colocynthis]|uniref:Uncharacterized protein n=1 Tax=Citrullus colocynthis TaxID=252529 RepID=A0ABP0YSU1_9ROSI
MYTIIDGRANGSLRVDVAPTGESTQSRPFEGSSTRRVIHGVVDMKEMASSCGFLFFVDNISAAGVKSLLC